MLTLLSSSCCSPVRLHLLLSALFLSLTLLSPVRSGFSSAENHCLNVNGVCRKDTCKLIEDVLGTCRRSWRCCRAWWILLPVPMPIIYSDYEAPHKKMQNET
ncbi:LOW QUALITY PROTEIN: putative beta-defensin 109B [Cervus elaphus]|uniref:LOW QUALITY PROTEIN: putative beta-defensin 109B n=1 Tax=Cervus elaphus TaxID=9860 RepID=UPI001CC2A6B7|nr:LOW QUALITY PROTEIN: putative beta-defensin 109B [Cervus elaphus]